MNPVRDEKFMFYVYVIKSKKNGKIYTGSTNDLWKRLKQHNDGKSAWTKNGIPWDLIYYEASLVEENARSREKYLSRLEI